LSSESTEEYLEAIYAFNENGELAKNSELAKRLRVSPPSVTQMIQKLSEDGLVEYQPYKGAALTGRGMAHARKVVRKHRLLERFLHDVLKLNGSKVHNEACRLEHSLSDETTAALCKSLENPDTCPDDERPIPLCTLDVEDCEECEEKRSENPKLLAELSNLKPGEEGVVAFVRGGTKACQRLLDMGLTRGTNVRVLNAAPFQGPIEVQVRGTNLALGRGLAGQVFIEIKDGSLEKRVHPHGPHHERGRRGWRR